MMPVKREILDEYDQQHFSLNKRPKHQEFGNPLDERCPLGLRLWKSPSLVNLIETRLAQVNASGKKGNKNISATDNKPKASHFPATLLKIGNWEYKSRCEGDLVAKCYFAKHKLIWEALDGGLKNKIEIQWSDIMALKATYPDDGPGCLHVMLLRKPLFFRETDPEPRKHTAWQTTGDFTGGQASLHRCHYLQCPPGLLHEHFEKLIQCDTRLRFISQQPVKSHKSVFDEPNAYDSSRGWPTIFDLHTTASSSVGQSSSSRIDLQGTSNNHPSMSMTDLVNHFGNRMTEQRTSSNHPLEDISRCLYSDGSTPSKVSSLCCLLQQKDPTTFQDLEPKANLNTHRPGSGSVDEVAVTEGTGMLRDDSIDDLLLNLPSIESLPEFFYNF